MNIPCKYLTDQIRSIKAQCNTVYPKICLENAHISVLGVEKYKKFAFSLEGGQNPTPNPPPFPINNDHSLILGYLALYCTLYL
jgi:hypothetical protein